MSIGQLNAFTGPNSLIATEELNQVEIPGTTFNQVEREPSFLAPGRMQGRVLFNPLDAAMTGNGGMIEAHATLSIRQFRLFYKPLDATIVVFEGIVQQVDISAQTNQPIYLDFILQATSGLTWNIGGERLRVRRIPAGVGGD